MSGNTFGLLYCVTSFGESHGPAYGGVVDGCPPGLELAENDIQRELDRRKPGSSRHVTQRQESDRIEILSGVLEGRTTGTAIGFVANPRSRSLLHRAIGSFRRHGAFPSEGAVGLESIAGVSRSDQWSYWKFGWPAVMVTDTAPFRYPHYHTLRDTPDKLDYDGLARVVKGLEGVVRELAGAPP